MDGEPISVLKLPLWKSCYEEMVKDGCAYGQTYETEYFEQRLKEKRETMAFGLAMSQIRTALLKHGLFLSGRGQKGSQFVIVDAAANSRVMENFQHQAAIALQKGVILGTNTRIDVLTEEERRKHEATLERLAVRSALMSRKVPTIKKALSLLEEAA